MVNNAPVICIVAPGSGYGKTALLEYLIGELKALGKSVCVLKHSGHDFIPDEGKDTFLHRQAGAKASAVLDEGGMLSVFIPGSSMEDSLSLLGRLGPDVILAEGFKGSAYPKIILLRDPEEFGILPALENVVVIHFEGQVPEWVRTRILRRKEEVLDVVLEYMSKAEQGVKK